MLRIPQCLDIRLTDGNEAVGLTRRPLYCHRPLHISLGIITRLVSVYSIRHIARHVANVSHAAYRIPTWSAFADCADVCCVLCHFILLWVIQGKAVHAVTLQSHILEVGYTPLTQPCHMLGQDGFLPNALHFRTVSFHIHSDSLIFVIQR
jgi:hypothetical protein